MDKSEELFAEAKRFLAGGVNSPVRAFAAVGGKPRFISRGRGSHLYDVDGNDLIDYICSWGALILGHAHPRVVAALKGAIEDGTSFGAPTERETVLARMITDALPSMQLVRFVSSGTEAIMSAIRVARAFTGRDMIVKFAGCYHGHSDGLLARAGSGVATLGLPDSAGVPGAYTRSTIVAVYNDLDRLDRIFERFGERIAGIIVEPVAANMGVVMPKPDFLQGLRHIADVHGALLIFDEVITGFRLTYGGAQSVYGVSPDLTCLGKIIGGGLPVGAYGGRRDIMELIAPMGPVYQAGTLSGNPLAMAGGIEALNTLQTPNVYKQLDGLAAYLAQGLENLAKKAGVKLFVSRVGSMLTPFFDVEKVSDYKSAVSSDTRQYAVFFNQMLNQGIYLPPSQFEAFFISLAHTEEDIENTLAAADHAFNAMRCC
ncbi:MAG: glutamate-1-semialdehyde 2,1-aminomutase [Dehalococcoidia bacterium]|nr:MAG: glutamate-1-semialdehyde 2,1-aminomutase [Dehalococcoidia bacterium]